jgi:hypothetical protein
LSTEDSIPIPYGYCHCGCGQKTVVAKNNKRDKGIRKGEPYRYIHGHNRRKSALEYIEEDRGYETPCWVWQRSISGGYGNMFHNGRVRLAHRVYYEREHGPIPDHLVPDHLCRVRACIRPSHIELVTGRENSRRGVSVKLNMYQAREIRRLFATGELDRDQLAERFGVTKANICYILNGKVWAED